MEVTSKLRTGQDRYCGGGEGAGKTSRQGRGISTGRSSLGRQEYHGRDLGRGGRIVVFLWSWRGGKGGGVSWYFRGPGGGGHGIPVAPTNGAALPWECHDPGAGSAGPLRLCLELPCSRMHRVWVCRLPCSTSLSWMACA